MQALWNIFIALSLSALAVACGSGKQTPESTMQPEQQQKLLVHGREIAGTTFATLSANLTKALHEGGVTEAVRYCNLAADPLVDSLSRVYHASIRRTSLKVRNPQNTPTLAERQILEVYAQQLKADQSPEPVIQQTDAQHAHFYAPIFVNTLCLQCHGIPGETMRTADYALIHELYPEDQATGYKDKDFRGIWSITFNSNGSKSN